MKYLIVIGDGMADNPVLELGFKTPLEKANIPTMDLLAEMGETGRAQTVPPGVEPGSDTAILNIFGYDPRQYFTGRSPLEAAGCGLVVRKGETAYRCNMVALSDDDVPYEHKRILSHSGGSVEGDDALQLMNDLQADARFALLAKQNRMVIHTSPSFRQIALQTGVDAQTLKTLHTTPPHDHLGKKISPLLPRGGALAENLGALMKLAHEILNDHPVNQKRRAQGTLPANGLWLWAQGASILLPNFEQLHHKKGFVVSAVPLVRGIGKLAGLDFVEVPGATGELDTNYEGKAKAALQGLANGYDFAVIHVESPDECTHNGDLGGKLQAIEWLDSRTLSPLLSGLNATGEPYRMLVLSDHKTLTATRGHNADPVPYLLYDSRTPTALGAIAYTEAECAKGVFIAEGSTLIKRLFEEET